MSRTPQPRRQAELPHLLLQPGQPGRHLDEIPAVLAPQLAHQPGGGGEEIQHHRFSGKTAGQELIHQRCGLGLLAIEHMAGEGLPPRRA